MLSAGRIRLDDLVQQFVPPPHVVPDWSCSAAGPGRPMTIGQLATYNAGLADFPPNLGVKADYTRADLWASFPITGGVCDPHLQANPGTEYIYSDWGFGLLGTILADLHLPSPDPIPNYGPMIDQLVTGPLGMTATRLEPSPPIADMATPTCGPTPAPCYWDNTAAFAGGGGLVSSITDMGTWVSANLGYDRNPAVWPALALTHQPFGVIPGCERCSNSGLAWFISPPGQDGPLTVLSKNGGTVGMESNTYLVPDACWGVTVLTNAYSPRAKGGPKPPSGVDVAQEVLDRFGPTAAVDCAGSTPRPSPRPSPVPVATATQAAPAFAG